MFYGYWNRFHERPLLAALSQQRHFFRLAGTRGSSRPGGKMADDKI